MKINSNACLSFFLITLVCFSSFSKVANATKVSPVVGVNFSTSTATTSMGGQVDLVLHVRASMQAKAVNIRFHIPPQVRVVLGGLPWTGTMTAGQTLNLPVSVIIQQAGEFTLSASAEVTDFNQSATAHMNIIASKQGVQISNNPFINMRLNQISPPQQQQYLESIGRPASVPVTSARSRTASEQRLDQYMLDHFQKNTQQQAGGATPPGNFPLAAAATTVSGTLNYQDDVGVQHPIRYARVQILDGVTNAVLKQVTTLSNGSYSAQVSAASIKVRVWSVDGFNSVVKVHPVGQPTVRYISTSVVTPVTGPATTVSFTLTRPVRGIPGTPSTDSVSSRAFIVYDALVQYQVQAFGMRGSLMAQVDAAFPNGAGSPCPTISCYSPSTQTMFILREDALDWDVIGHEFFHYVTNQGALRSIDNNPGGSHDGFTQIGKNRCPTPPVPPSTAWTTHVCSRDEGMKLAWSEGTATFMAVRLQIEPASTAFGLTWPNLPNVGDTSYQDTEDATILTNMESIAPDGYGSENSVAAMLWDLTDTPAESAPPGGPGQALDQFDLSPKDIWSLINQGLPCPVCDRPDRFWNALSQALMTTPSTLVAVAEEFALNKLAPELTAPAEASVVSGGISPVFKWVPNGDPSVAHRPNRFTLIISKDGFVSDFHSFPAGGQPITGIQYQIPSTDWQALMAGSSVNTTFSWIVLAWRKADTDIRLPEGSGYWVSNKRTFKARAFHIQMTWNKLGADVDLHLRPPSGQTFVGWRFNNDAAYYNRNPDWGVLGDPTDNPSLDRDCITSCTEENITIDKVTTAGVYKVMAHYFRDHLLGPSTVTVKVFQFGNLIFTGTKALNNVSDTSGGGDLWTVLTITIPPGGLKPASITPQMMNFQVPQGQSAVQPAGAPDSYKK